MTFAVVMTYAVLAVEVPFDEPIGGHEILAGSKKISVDIRCENERLSKFIRVFQEPVSRDPAHLYSKTIASDYQIPMSSVSFVLIQDMADYLRWHFHILKVGSQHCFVIFSGDEARVVSATILPDGMLIKDVDECKPISKSVTLYSSQPVT